MIRHYLFQDITKQRQAQARKYLVKRAKRRPIFLSRWAQYFRHSYRLSTMWVASSVA